jgi:seryl-tRNA synthetase
VTAPATDWFSIPLARTPQYDLASDIEKQGGYVSPHVRRVEVVGASVRYQVAGVTEEEMPEVHAKMSRYLDLMVLRFRQLPRKVIHARTAQRRPLEPDAFARLQALGWARHVGPGRVALAGPALNALRALDEDARHVATEHFGAREEVYPTLIPTEILGRCGYLGSFPQYVSLVTHLPEDLDAIERFREGHADKTDLCVPDASVFVTPKACLSPALCYHCYMSLERSRLSADTHVVTTVGKCFRYESIAMAGLERLWDFTMREVVFVGTEGDVQAHRQRGMDQVQAQLERWDLAGHIETANDPFFSATYASKSYAQLRNELKFELRLPVGEGAAGPRSIACASFNLHDNFFGRTFSIEARDGRPAFTGCIGWGLERWVLALFAQHGFDAGDWPAEVRSSVWG